MCGASSEQKQIEASQSAFYDTMRKESSDVFGMNSKLYQQLVSAFQPIFDKGPGQKGFSDEESAALHTQATEGVARNYQAASKAVREQQAAEGGGNVNIPSGQESEIKAELAGSAAAQESSEASQITEADYETGRQNWESAKQGMLEAGTVMNGGAAYAGAATDAGSAASKTANEISQANNSWMGAVGGMLGTAVGGWASGGFKTSGG